MSLVWEGELEQNPDTAPGVHGGASSTKSLILLQELTMGITSGSACSMMRGQEAGEATHPAAFPQQMVSRRLEAVWFLCLGRE